MGRPVKRSNRQPERPWRCKVSAKPEGGGTVTTTGTRTNPATTTFHRYRRANTGCGRRRLATRSRTAKSTSATAGPLSRRFLRFLRSVGAHETLIYWAFLVPGARLGQPPRHIGCRSLCSLALYRPRSGHPTAAAKSRPPRRRLPPSDPRASDEVRWKG
jgi:hypothetical protein